MDLLGQALDWIWAHSAFFSALFCLMMAGQVMKTSVFTEAKARTRSSWQWFWWWAWKTLPLHPVLAGWGLGYVVVEPEPGISGSAANLYFAHAGVHSVWVYDVLKRLAKRKGIEIRLPGESAPPKA